MVFPKTHAFYRGTNVHKPTGSSPTSVDWEVFSVATLGIPRYRKKGLVDQCLRKVDQELLQRAKLAHVEGYKHKVQMWLHTIDEVNGTYWRKKGFQDVGERHILPKGVWNKELDFTLVKMNRVCTDLPKLSSP